MSNRFCLILALLLSQGCHLTYATFDYGGDAGALDDAATDSGPDGGADGGVDSGPDAGPPIDAGCPDMCNGACTNTDTDIAHCGECNRSCSAPANGTAVCEDGMCDVECDPGFALVGGLCVELVPPRPLAPLSTSRTTSQRPTLRWTLAPQTEGARVQLCSDRACATVIETVDASGTSATPAADLPQGVVFWRLLARIGDDVGITPGPTWQFNVGARTAPIDTSWGTALDVNGDGFADVAVSAFKVDSSRGRVRIYLGGPTGVAETAATTLAGPAGADGLFGRSVASAGDVNGDGFADLIVGASLVDFGSGRAYIYHGGPGGLDTTAATVLTWTTTGSRFGSSVASAGDVNGDGFADVVVGAPEFDDRGAALVYHGGAGGVSTSVASTISGPDGLDAFYGSSVAGAGDVNGDGFADVAVGSLAADSGAGRVRVYNGGDGGLSVTPAIVLTGFDGSNTFVGDVAAAGDLNGDGYADIVIGPGDEETAVDRAHVYSGGAGGVSATPTTLIGPDGGTFGFSTAGVGDADGDGFDDLVVSAYAYSSGLGRLYVYRGSTGALGTSPSTTVSGPSGMIGGFGFSVSGAGDVNGDGAADVIAGSPFTDSNAGRAYVFHGEAGGLSETPAALLLSPDASGEFGSRVAGRGGG